MSFWKSVRDSIFTDPDQISTLKSFIRIVLFQITLFILTIIFGFVFALSTSKLLSSFAIAVIISNLIYHVIMFVADTGDVDTTVGETTELGRDLGTDLGFWRPFNVLFFWYVMVILILTIFLRNVVFTT